MKRSPAVVVVPLMVLFLVCGPAWASAGAKVLTVGGGAWSWGGSSDPPAKGFPATMTPTPSDSSSPTAAASS